MLTINIFARNKYAWKTETKLLYYLSMTEENYIQLLITSVS